MTGSTQAQIIEHSNSNALAIAVARQLAKATVDGLNRHRHATLALAGGGTPMPIYRLLSHLELDWPRVRALPGDERWVAADHPACNFSAMAACFSRAPLELLPLVPAQPGPAPGLEQAQDSLSKVAGDFDAVLLGMGGDGHFASLFPGSSALAVGLDPKADADVLIDTPDPMPPDAPFPRISLTLSRLMKTRCLLLAITGQTKREVLEQALSGERQTVALPIAALLAAAGDSLTIHWSP